jgi:hypothetical protein
MKKKWFKETAVYTIFGLFLIGCVGYSAYLMIFQIGPALAGQGPELEAARNLATILNVAAPVFTIIILLLAISDRITRRRAQVGEWNQKHFDDLVDEIEKFVSISDLRKRDSEINGFLMAADSGAVWAEQRGDGTKENTWGFITNGMEGRYSWNLPQRVKPVFEELARVTATVDAEQAKLFKQRVRAKTSVQLCGWILVDACSRKDTELLKAAHILGIDLLAINNFEFPGNKQIRLEALPKMIERLLS